MFAKKFSLLAAVLVLGMSSAALALPISGPSVEERMTPSPDAKSGTKCKSGTNLHFKSKKSAPLNSIKGYVDNDLTGDVSGLPSGSSNGVALNWDQGLLGGSYFTKTGDNKVSAGGGWSVETTRATGYADLSMGSKNNFYVSGKLDDSGVGSFLLTAESDIECVPDADGKRWWTCTKGGAAAAAAASSGSPPTRTPSAA